MQSVKITPPNVIGALWDERMQALRYEVEPAYALKTLVTVSDLAIVSYRQGFIQAIDMVTREQRWQVRIMDGVEDNEACFFSGLQCVDSCPHGVNGGQGGCLAVGFREGRIPGRIDLLHAPSGDRIRSLPAPVPDVDMCSFSSSGAKIAVAGGWLGDPSQAVHGVVVLCTSTAQLLHRIAASKFTSTVNCLAFVGSERLVTGSNDSVLRLWQLGEESGSSSRSRSNTRDTECIRSFQMSDWVTSCAASADGTKVVCCSLSDNRRGTRTAVYDLVDLPTLAVTAKVHLQHKRQCRASFCDSGVLIGESSRFESITRRVHVWVEESQPRPSEGRHPPSRVCTCTEVSIRRSGCTCGCTGTGCSTGASAGAGTGAGTSSLSAGPPQVMTRSFGKGEFAAPVSWLPSAAFRDYPTRLYA